ncbi:MAG: hypothetical protein ACYS0G_12185 [Planctomycetota bacterium]|jgi:hypothetical protein
MEPTETTPPGPPGMTPAAQVVERLEKPSGWPMAIGVINIVLASIGLLCYGCGSINTMVSPWLAGMVPEDQQPVTAQGVQLVVQVVQMCAAALMSVWLLFAGIGLTRRRAWSRVNCIGWSIVKILLSLLGTGIGLLFAQQTVDQFNDQLSKSGQAFTLTVPMIMIAVVVSLAWFMIWPIFMLIWFSRAKIREEVAQWEAESRAMI